MNPYPIEDERDIAIRHPVPIKKKGSTLVPQDQLWGYLISRQSRIIPIGSIVLLYIVTWIPSIYPVYVSIYTSTMDPMGYRLQLRMGKKKSPISNFFWKIQSRSLPSLPSQGISWASNHPREAWPKCFQHSTSDEAVELRKNPAMEENRTCCFTTKGAAEAPQKKSTHHVWFASELVSLGTSSSS